MSGQPLRPGDRLPSFRRLKATDGKQYAAEDFGENILVIVFSCNHCPYVQAYEDRMVEFQSAYASKGVRLVAINSNDLTNYPADSFEQMIVRARQKKFNFPYLRDDDQSAAEAFGATHTPQFFVFDKERNLRYSGKMDDSWNDPAAAKHFYLRDAVDALLKGEAPPVAETFSIGCTIKWRA